MKDINEIRRTVLNLNAIQKTINITSVEDLNNENVIFGLIDNIKSFKGDISSASSQ